MDQVISRTETVPSVPVRITTSGGTYDAEQPAARPATGSARPATGPGSTTAGEPLAVAGAGLVGYSPGAKPAGAQLPGPGRRDQDAASGRGSYLGRDSEDAATTATAARSVVAQL